MAAARPAQPIYHDPTPRSNRSRRSSSRNSLVSPLSRSASDFESPRSLCPKDGDAFSYDPAHLRVWYLPQEIWDHLPADLRSALATVQHAGAAVLTGFARLDKHTEGLDSGRSDFKLPDDDLSLDTLPSPRFRTFSHAGSMFPSDLSSPVTVFSSASASGSASPDISASTLSQTVTPLSPVSLGRPEDFDKKESRSREHSFSTPLEPNDAHYAAELSHLRTEALVRLRHAGRKVDAEWYEAKRSSNITANDVEAFDKWWAEKKHAIVSLSEKGNRLATALGLPPTGLGWSAP